MAVSTYKAQLNYYDPTYGWGNEGTTCQGNWTGAGGNRTGVMYFPGLSALKDKIINSVKLKVTTGKTGNNESKTAKFYTSASQGGIKTSLGANHKTGSSIGSVTGTMYNNSSTFTITFLSAHIVAGEDTFCIYDTGTINYLKWSAVTLEIDWSEPATQPTLDLSGVDLGNPVTITTTATNSAYRHTLRYAFGDATGTIASNVATFYAWTPPVSLAAQIPNATSGIGTIYCDTYNGSTLLGTKSVSITLKVPASVVPSAGTLSASVVDDTSGTGLYVKGMGKARVRLSSAAGAQGSTIKSTKISGGGWSESDADMTTGILTTSGTIVFTATVTDSRGRTATADCSITVEDYSKPQITICSVYRCDAGGTKKNDGTYVAIEIAAAYSAISGNSLSLSVAYKLATASSYGSSATLTNNGKTVIGGSISAASTYNVRITVEDKYNRVTRTYKLGTKTVDISVLKGIGVAIGKVAEIAGFDVGWSARFRETVTIDKSCTLTGTLTANGGITLPNGGNGLAIKNSGGEAWDIMYLGTSNNLIIGVDLYNNAVGNTNIYAGVNAVLRVPNDNVGLYSVTSDTYSAYFRPGTNGKCALGTSSYPWHSVYATNATIQTSDARRKENIVPLGASASKARTLSAETGTDIHSELFDRLQPVQYSLIDGNGRICYGLIAQDVAAAMQELGIGEDDLDLVHHDLWTDEKTGEVTDTYGLAYANLIALLVHEVQMLKSKIT